MNQLFCLSLCLMLLQAGTLAALNPMLLGSVVKSDTWKMDRVKKTDSFDGNVSFKNDLYDLKADHAVYNRSLSLWTLNGSVYCKRRFINGASLELYGDSGLYEEKPQTAAVSRGTEPVRMTHTSANGKTLKGRSAKVKGDYLKSTMDFIGEFYMITDNTEIFSDNAFYSDTEKSFFVYGASDSLKNNPVAIGTREDKDFAISAEKIKYYRESGDIKLNNDVAGWIKAEKNQDKYDLKF